MHYWCWKVDWLWMTNWKGFRIKRPWPVSNIPNVPAMCSSACCYCIHSKLCFPTCRVMLHWTYRLISTVGRHAMRYCRSVLSVMAVRTGSVANLKGSSLSLHDVDWRLCDSSVSRDFPVFAHVSSVGGGIGLSNLWRSGDRERDVINAISYRTNTSRVPIAV
jgi:hypothetical protein